MSLERYVTAELSVNYAFLIALAMLHNVGSSAACIGWSDQRRMRSMPDKMPSVDIADSVMISTTIRQPKFCLIERG